MTDLSTVSDADLMASLPRGVRNNNPLNVEDGAFARSHPGYAGSDGRFAKFDTMDAGLAAADHNLQGYHTRHGLNTVAGIVNRWAPPVENDTGSYVRFVAKKAGVDPNAPLDMANPGVRQALLGAMAEHENGVPVTAPKAADLSQVSDADLLASLDVKPKVVPYPQLGPGVTIERDRPTVPQRSTASDIAQGGASGLQKGTASVADAVQQAGPMGMIGGGLQTAAGLASFLSGQGRFTGATPFSANSQRAAANGYKPTTSAGKFAQTVGTMVPNALVPGSAASRVASVVLPAVGQEGGERTAKALGFGERGQQIGGMIGAGIGGVGSALRMPTRAAKLPTGNLETLQNANNAAWAKVGASGFRFPKKDVQAASQDIANLVKEADPDLYPEAAKVAAKVQRMATRGELSPAQANRLRSQVGEKLLAPGSTETSIGGAIKARIDSLIDSANEPVLAEARKLHTQYLKAKEVTNRVDSAALAQETAGTGGNQNAVRQKLRPLIDPKSPQRIKNLTPDEVKAVRKVTKGTTGQNALRLLTAFDPTAGKLQAMLSTGGAALSHGTSLAMMPVGMAAKAGEKAIGAKNIQGLIDLIAAGGVAPKAVAKANPAREYAGTAGVTSMLLSATPAIAGEKRRPPQRQKARRP